MTSKRPPKVLKTHENPPKRKKSHPSHKGRVTARPPSSSKENEAPASQTQEGRRTVTVHWSKPEYHFVTDLLLSAIEEHAPTCTALGFDLSERDGSNSSNKSNGKVVHEHYIRLARKVFLESGRFSKYTENDLEELAGVIKNRVIRIKGVYRECRARLRDTGAGLVDEDREDEFEEGSELANIWDAIRREFPWYKRVNLLMRRHPLVDRSAVANSTTDLDLSILDRNQKNIEDTVHDRTQPPPPLSHTDDGDADSRSSSGTDTEKSDLDDDYDIDSSSDTDGTAAAVKELSKRKPPSPASTANPSTSKRRKTMLQHVEEIAAADRQARLQRMRMQLRARHKYKLKKEELRCALERDRLEHDARERDKQRAHELKLIEAQTELERIRLAGRMPLGATVAPPPALPTALGCNDLVDSTVQ